MENQRLRFSKKDSKRFFITLNKRVNDHFKNLNIAKTGNWKLYIKTLIMFSLFISPYFLILFTDFDSWIKIGLCVIMGIGMAGVGMNVMHDGNHGSFSKKNWINKLKKLLIPKTHLFFLKNCGLNNLQLKHFEGIQ